ncbi:MAG: hypothetical protein IT374_20680 [Polyangiaceae bacterium]|nr:hypothetical protein [Polyangiaceae bacterium]
MPPLPAAVAAPAPPAPALPPAPPFLHSVLWHVNPPARSHSAFVEHLVLHLLPVQLYPAGHLLTWPDVVFSSVALAHVVTAAPHWPVTLSHCEPGAQSASPAQVFLQVFVAASQRNASHEIDVVWQVPCPSQLPDCWVLPVQVGVPHFSPAGRAARHSPPGPQSPSPLHASADFSQALLGSVPSFASPHLPSMPDWLALPLHDRQAPAHSLSQQTPSTQKPESQSPPFLHATPVSSLETQAPSLPQKYPTRHSASPVQLVAQVLAAQT